MWGRCIPVSSAVIFPGNLSHSPHRVAVCNIGDFHLDRENLPEDVCVRILGVQFRIAWAFLLHAVLLALLRYSSETINTPSVTVYPPLFGSLCDFHYRRSHRARPEKSPSRGLRPPRRFSPGTSHPCDGGNYFCVKEDEGKARVRPSSYRGASRVCGFLDSALIKVKFSGKMEIIFFFW